MAAPPQVPERTRRGRSLLSRLPLARGRLAPTKLPLLDERGRIIGTFGIARDVTAQMHDSVTGLANRVALIDRLTQALLAFERRPGRVGLLFLDIDAFKSINDTLATARATECSSTSANG